jgi:hypothetical protein
VLSLAFYLLCLFVQRDAWETGWPSSTRGERRALVFSFSRFRVGTTDGLRVLHGRRGDRKFARRALWARRRCFTAVAHTHTPTHIYIRTYAHSSTSLFFAFSLFSFTLLLTPFFTSLSSALQPVPAASLSSQKNRKGKLLGYVTKELRCRRVTSSLIQRLHTLTFYYYIEHQLRQAITGYCGLRHQLKSWH